MSQDFKYLDRILLNSNPEVWGTVIRTRDCECRCVEVEFDTNLGVACLMLRTEISHV